MNRILKKTALIVLSGILFAVSCFFFCSCSCSGLVVLTEAEIVNLWEDNVVSIASYGSRKYADGTGIIFGYEPEVGSDKVFPYIVTNKHIISQNNRYLERVTFSMNGVEGEFEAAVLASNGYHDIAVLKSSAAVDKKFYNLFDVGEYNIFLGSFFASASDGETMYSFGNEDGAGIIHYTGVCNTGKKTIETAKLEISSSNKMVPVISTSAKIAPGMSGGPLVNGYGQLVGICTYEGEETDQGLSCYAVDVGIALKVYASAVTYGERGELNMFGFNDGEREYSSLLERTNEESPLSVLSDSEGNLFKLGFNGIMVGDGEIQLYGKGAFFSREGYDRIVKIDNKSFRNYSEFFATLYEYEVVSSTADGNPASVFIRSAATNNTVRLEWKTEDYKVVRKTKKQDGGES